MPTRSRADRCRARPAEASAGRPTRGGRPQSRRCIEVWRPGRPEGRRHPRGGRREQRRERRAASRRRPKPRAAAAAAAQDGAAAPSRSSRAPKRRDRTPAAARPQGRPDRRAIGQHRQDRQDRQPTGRIVRPAATASAKAAGRSKARDRDRSGARRRPIRIRRSPSSRRSRRSLRPTPRSGADDWTDSASTNGCGTRAVVRTRTAAAALAERRPRAGQRRSASMRPSRAVRAGDVVTVALDRAVRILKVTDFAERRGPAAAARCSTRI